MGELTNFVGLSKAENEMWGSFERAGQRYSDLAGGPSAYDYLAGAGSLPDYAAALGPKTVWLGNFKTEPVHVGSSHTVPYVILSPVKGVGIDIDTLRGGFWELVAGQSRRRRSLTLEPLRAAISESRKALFEGDPPDEESGLRSCSAETWQRATDFLLAQARWLDTTCSVAMPVPRIVLGVDAGIDLHWSEAQFELLIGIPADPAKHARFYGDDRGDFDIKGSLDTNRFNQGLLLWLASFRPSGR